MLNFERGIRAVWGTATTLRPYGEALWKGRVVTLLLAVVCISVLALAKRLYHLFEKKRETSPPQIPVFQASSEQQKIDVTPPFAIQPLRLPPAIPPSGESSCFENLPDEVLRILFWYATSSFIEWRILLRTCKQWNQLITKDPAQIGIQYLFSPLIEKIGDLPYLSLSLVAAEIGLFDTIFSLPACLLFPNVNGVCISQMQEMFLNIDSINNIAKILREFREELYPQRVDMKTHVTDLDQQFLLNLPNSLLTSSSRAEVEEMNRRDNLKQLSLKKDAFIHDISYEVAVFWSSTSLFKSLVENSDRKSWFEYLLVALHRIKDEQQFSEKLFILGENFKKKYFQLNEVQKRDTTLTGLLYATLYALSWQDEECLQKSTLLTIPTILLWIPDEVFASLKNYLRHFSLFRFAPLQMPTYAYSPQHLVSFLECLDKKRSRLPHPPYDCSAGLLQQMLSQGGATLYFDQPLWAIALSNKDNNIVYGKLLVLGDFYKHHFDQWSLLKAHAILRMLLFTSMDLLRWKSEGEKRFTVSPKKRKRLPQSMQLSLKLATYSWISKGELHRGIARWDNNPGSGDDEQDFFETDPLYICHDLVVFIQHIIDECAPYTKYHK